jgi:hypothetical protein
VFLHTLLFSIFDASLSIISSTKYYKNVNLILLIIPASVLLQWESELKKIEVNDKDKNKLISYLIRIILNFQIIKKI